MPTKTSTLTMTIPLTKNTVDISVNTSELANNFSIPIDESVIAHKNIFIIGLFNICIKFYNNDIIK